MCFCSSLEVLRAARAVAPDVVIYNGDFDYRACAGGDPQEFVDLFDSLFGAPPPVRPLWPRIPRKQTNKRVSRPRWLGGACTAEAGGSGAATRTAPSAARVS